MTLNEAIENNKMIYYKWIIKGRPEADDNLNDSNRNLINAYKKNYPNAKGYMLYKGVVEIPNVVYNFDLDYIFNGDDTELIQELEKEKEEYKKLNILDKNNAICLVWS